MRFCRLCNNEVLGRADKIFCDIKCKNAYNLALRRQTKLEVKPIDRLLHRNREILQLLLGSLKKVMIDKIVMTRANFYWDHCTGLYHNKDGKIYHLVYDYAWMEFSSQQILVVKKKFNLKQTQAVQIANRKLIL